MTALPATTTLPAKDLIRQIIERVERLTEEKQSLFEDINEVYSEAKALGLDTKILRKLISIRKQDADDRANEEALIDLYKTALGM